MAHDSESISLEASHVPAEPAAPVPIYFTAQTKDVMTILVSEANNGKTSRMPTLTIPLDNGSNASPSCPKSPVSLLSNAPGQSWLNMPLEDLIYDKIAVTATPAPRSRRIQGEAFWMELWKTLEIENAKKTINCDPIVVEPVSPSTMVALGEFWSTHSILDDFTL